MMRQEQIFLGDGDFFLLVVGRQNKIIGKICDEKKGEMMRMTKMRGDG